MGREVVLTEEFIEAIQARSRRWLLLRVLLVVAALSAGVWWLWYRPLPAVYVAVVQPEVDESLPAGIRGSLRMSLSADLSLLRNVYPLRSDEVDAGGKDLRELADAVGAGEIVTSRVTDNGDSCRVEITRTWTDTRHQSSQSFDVTPVSAVAISSAVSQRMRDLYRERRHPLRKPQEADYAALSEIWIRQSEQGSDTEQVLLELTKLRKDGKAPVDAIAAEISVARYLFETTGDQQFFEHAQEVLGDAPDHPDITLAGVELALASGDTDRAQKLLDTVSEDHPYFWWYQRWIYQSNSEWERASDVIYMALIRRESWRHYFALGRVWRKAGQIERARQSYEKAVKMVPGNVQVTEELAYLELNNGDLGRARELLLQLMTINQDFRHRYGESLATADMLLGNYQEAAETLRLEVSLGYETPSVLLNLAEAYYHLGDHRAEPTFEQLLNATEGTESAFLIAYRAQALACLGQTADASATIEYALSRDRSCQLLYIASIVYCITGDRQRADELVRESMEKGMGRRWFDLPWFVGMEIDR